MLAAADDLEQRGTEFDKVAPLYRRLLADESGAATPFGFRARVGLLRALLRSAEESAAEESVGPPPELVELSAVVGELRAKHELELQPYDSVRVDAASVTKLVAHAELLVDAWTRCFGGEESTVLRLYAQQQEKEALTTALQWYQQAASGDLVGLIKALYSPLRYVPDRRGEPPPSPCFSEPPFAEELDEAPGPAAPRSLIRRLFTAMGHTHPLVAEARADLEFLLDKKPHVPFYTRCVYIRRGGRPTWGKGTGKRSGYSRRYWLCWGPGTRYRNSRKMGSPHCDKND